jgi:hypothetical protein
LSVVVHVDIRFATVHSCGIGWRLEESLTMVRIVMLRFSNDQPSLKSNTGGLRNFQKAVVYERRAMNL